MLEVIECALGSDGLEGMNVSHGICGKVAAPER